MYNVFISKKADKYLHFLSEKEHERCLTSIKRLGENPFRKRPGCDIKKKGGEDGYRLRVGRHRFNYAVDRGQLIVTIEEGFSRERGYR